MLNQLDRNRGQERLVDVVLYILSLVQSTFRFSKGLPPFDFENLSVAEFLTCKSLPFVENEDIPYPEAHKIFIQSMFEYGWTYGLEDFIKKTHTDLVEYSELPIESKEMYGFMVGIICSAKEFYQSLKIDLEAEFMDSFDIKPVGISGVTSFGGSGVTH